MVTQITPEMLLGPAQAPPPGIIPNLVDPPSVGVSLIITGTILAFFMTMAMANRLVLKLFIIRGLSWDDATCVIGFVLTILTFATCICAVKYAKFGTHLWNVPLGTFIGDNTQIILYILELELPLTLLFIKTTFFLLFLQLFKPAKVLKIAIWAGFVFTVLFYVLAIILTLIAATPRPGETWIGHSQNSSTMTIVVSESLWLPAIGIVIDLYILVLPLYAVSTLHLSRKRKFQLASTFMTGIVAVIASVLTLVFRALTYDAPFEDLTYRSFPVLLVTLVEMMVGVTVLCMPSLAKTVRHFHSESTAQQSRFAAGHHSGDLKLASIGNRSRLTSNQSANKDKPYMLEMNSQDRRDKTDGGSDSDLQPLFTLSKTIQKSFANSVPNLPASTTAETEHNRSSGRPLGLGEIHCRYDIHIESRERGEGDSIV